MADKKVTNYEVMKALYPQTPPTWDSRISLESKEYWEASRVLINSSTFSPIRNEIYDALINRIALVKVISNEFNNPLKRFKRGELEYGNAVQEIATDVIPAHKFRGGETNQFEVFPADVHAAYHVINREEYYPITIEDPRMKRAFVEEYGLQKLIKEIISTLEKSNTIDEYIFTKKLISNYFSNTDYSLQNSQIIKVPDLTIPQNKTDLNIKSFLETVKLALRSTMFPNRNYTSSKIMCQSLPSDMVMLLDIRYTVIGEVYSLSSAFSPEYLDLSVPIIGIDNFGEDHPEIIGVILDNNALDIYNTLQAMGSAENGRSLYKNYFYHVQQLFMASPFKTAIFLTK